MKKVVLLGDSIRLFYAPRVIELLGDEYQVWTPTDNCRFVKNTLRMLFDFRSDIDGADVIHWNNGLWDTSTGLFGDGLPFTTEDEYVSNMLRVAAILKKMAPRVIFATTTPCRPDYEYNDNDVINLYNAVIVPKLKEMGIEINDLHSLVNQDVYKYIRDDDKLHINDCGIELCANQVAKVIKAK